MKIHKYPDNTSYAEVDGDETTFTHKINSYEDLWHLNQKVDALNNMGVTPTVTIPCLIDAQADRRFGNNQSSGLRLVCKFLNSMDARFKIFHPHNPEAVEALMNNVEINDNVGYIMRILSEYFNGGRGVNGSYQSSLILMSSDSGSFKPLMKLCDKIGWQGETFPASKSRKYEDGETKLTQLVDREDFGGKDILIVDDICVYGGTFKGLAKLLRERNCGKLYLAVSHMTVQDLGEDPVTNYFDDVFTTNSKFDNYGITGNHIARGMHEFTQPKNLTVINLF